MKLSVNNLGCIKAAKIEIAPLTVFIGPNNTNKTWTAYTLYGLCRSVIAHWPVASEYYDLVTLDWPLTQNIEAAVTQVMASLSEGSDAISTSAEVSRDQLLSGVTFPLHATASAPFFRSLLGVTEHTLGSASTSLELLAEDIRNDLKSVAFTLERTSQGRVLTVLLIDTGGRDSKTAARLPFPQSEQLLKTTIRSYVRYLLAGAYESVLAFPAERKALNSVYWFIRVDGGDYALSRPVIDFIRLLQGAPWSGSTAGHSGFVNVANDLEQRVLGGNVGFEIAGGQVPRLEYRIANENPIGIHAASSLVKSLGPLDVYLRMFAQENDLVIIDEPEMNAHPDAQLAIAELLAILVNRGLKIVVTTQSPYIVDHLKNLMELAASKAQVREGLTLRLKLGSPKAFLSADKVAVYLFNRDGQVASILNREERLIDWSTFSNTSEEVTNLYADILEANRGE